MAMSAGEIKEWLSTIDDGEEIAVDDGGLTLVVVGHEDECWIEIGGIPLEED